MLAFSKRLGFTTLLSATSIRLRHRGAGGEPLVRRAEVLRPQADREFVAGVAEVADREVVAGEARVEEGFDPAVVLHPVGERVADDGRCDRPFSSLNGGKREEQGLRRFSSLVPPLAGWLQPKMVAARTNRPSLSQPPTDEPVRKRERPPGIVCSPVWERGANC